MTPRRRTHDSVLVAVAVLVTCLQFVITIGKGPPPNSDFINQYYPAAQLLRSHQSPYEWCADASERPLCGYFLPPQFLLLIMPLTALSPEAASGVWAAVQTFLIWPLAAYYLRKSLPLSITMLVCICSLTWLPVIFALRL